MANTAWRRRHKDGNNLSNVIAQVLYGTSIVRSTTHRAATRHVSEIKTENYTKLTRVSMATGHVTARFEAVV